MIVVAVGLGGMCVGLIIGGIFMWRTGGKYYSEGFNDGAAKCRQRMEAEGWQRIVN